MQQPQPDPLAVRDRLRRNFALLGVSTRVELTTYGLSRAVVVNPLTLAEATMLAEALEGSPRTGVSPR
jgi:hypothetical protein